MGCLALSCPHCEGPAGGPSPPVGEPAIHQILTTLVPMLAMSDPGVQLASLARASHSPSWMFDTKLDGVRALAAWDGRSLTMRNRNNREMDNYPDLEVAAIAIEGPVILDGEIVAGSGRFQDAAWRDKQHGANAARAVTEHPAYFKAFDCLWHPERGDVRHLPYSERRSLLLMLKLEQNGGGRWSPTEASTDPTFYEVIRQLGGEGVVAKRLTARYEPGRRNSWLKYKNKHRVTCVGSGYEPGKGARIAFGSLFLTVINPDGTLNNIGKVGSGFTLAETLSIKGELDTARAVGDLPIVEIECLGITRDGKLRQPVFVGWRTDQGVADAVTAQLDSLPVT
jgi:bifunctional non-homologous end joining protein LigD